MSTAPTPGPWASENGVIRDGRGRRVAETATLRDKDEELANGHLLAAGPDLANAVRALLAVLPVNWREDGEIAGARRIGIDALDRAEGRAR